MSASQKTFGSIAFFQNNSKHRRQILTEKYSKPFPLLEKLKSIHRTPKVKLVRSVDRQRARQDWRTTVLRSKQRWLRCCVLGTGTLLRFFFLFGRFYQAVDE